MAPAVRSEYLLRDRDARPTETARVRKNRHRSNSSFSTRYLTKEARWLLCHSRLFCSRDGMSIIVLGPFTLANDVRDRRRGFFRRFCFNGKRDSWKALHLTPMFVLDLFGTGFRNESDPRHGLFV